MKSIGHLLISIVFFEFVALVDFQSAICGSFQAFKLPSEGSSDYPGSRPGDRWNPPCVCTPEIFIRSLAAEWHGHSFPHFL